MPTAGRPRVVPTVAVTGVLLAGCSSVERPDPVGPYYTVRAEALAGAARIRSGASMAMDPPGKPQTAGDQTYLRDSLGLLDAAGERGVFDARFSPDSELRLGFDHFRSFIGSGVLDSPRQFDGAKYPPGTHVHGDLDWDRAAISFAQRVAEFRGDGPPIDVVARVGAERDQYFTVIEAARGLRGDRFAYAAAPFGGVEARIGICAGLTVVPGADAGYLRYGDKKFALADAKIELLWNVSGPFDLLASYEFSSHHIEVHRSTGERSDVRANVGIWLVGIGLHF